MTGPFSCHVPLRHFKHTKGTVYIRGSFLSWDDSFKWDESTKKRSSVSSDKEKIVRHNYNFVILLIKTHNQRVHDNYILFKCNSQEEKVGEVSLVYVQEKNEKDEIDDKNVDDWRA